MLVMLLDKDEFTQMVGIAQTMVTLVVVKVGWPVVMHGCAPKLRQDTDVIHGLGSSLRMNGIVSQSGGTADMDPLEFAGHA